MKVYLVKFDCGYYAAKQPHYDWSFTDDRQLANRYKTKKAAEERANDGMNAGKYWRQYGHVHYPNKITASSVEIEECELVETLTLVNVHS